jgi:DNA-binding LacI/PurR family transcriptional regulator
LERRVTLKDVAAQAGVSYQTVSKVINRTYRVPADTEARIWTAVSALGYVPDQQARNLRSQRSRMIGYSWQSEIPPETSSNVMNAFLTAMVEEAAAADYYLLPFSHPVRDAHVDDYRRLIGSGRVDGFVLSSIDYDDRRLAFLLEAGFPFVGFGRSNSELDFPWVDVDGGLGLKLAVDHLVERGHRRIAFIGVPGPSRVGDDRLGGYLAALLARGLESDPDLVARGAASFEFGRDAAARWLDLPADRRPTAIATVCDTQAVGAMHGARSRGLMVGRDVAIIGFDDDPSSRMLWPPLTTIRQPLREVGRTCVELLIRLIESQPVERRQVLLAPELIVREST